MPTLNWDKRQQAEKTLTQVPYRLLKYEREYTSAKEGAESNSNNMLIQGDNLDALKALVPQYEGRIKCIFIDPPYNTGSAFTHYDDKLAHNAWLALMYPRLKLLHQLLADDGSIWVTIDDNEAHYLKIMLDEIFVRSNFISNLVWQKKTAPQGHSLWFSDNHDHVLVFAKNKEKWFPNPLGRTLEQDARYNRVDETGDFYTPDNFTISLTGGQRGAQFARTGVSENIYEITLPSGRKVFPPKGRCWLVKEARYHEMLADGLVVFAKNGDGVPMVKRYLKDVKKGTVPLSVMLHSDVGGNTEAKKEVREFNDSDIFSTPKPERLLERILHIATKHNDLVLDSFLGSGTTAAVAHKMGRRWIGIEMGEHARTHCLPRLEKVIEGEQGGISQSVGWQGGGSFAFYTLGEAVFLPNGHINPKIKFDELAQYVWQSVTRSFSAYTTPKIDEKESPIKTISSQIQNPTEHKDATPLLGIHNDVVYFLLYNGILRDRRPEGGNVLTPALWQWLLTLVPPLQTKKLRYVVYGEACQISKSRRDAMGLVFKQMPYKLTKV